MQYRATSPSTEARPFGWIDIVRLGLVQMSLGGIVVLTTSTINRVMVVELALPAIIPGLLVALHYATQVLRPRWGYGSDVGGKRTPWVIGGMAVLAIGGVGSAAATALMSISFAAGVALAIVAFLLIGLGVGAAGTSLLVLMATSVAPERRAAAATIVWVMMICGFIVTTILAGQFLDPFSMPRLIAVSAAVSAIAFTISTLAVWGLERRSIANVAKPAAHKAAKPSFRTALKEVWDEPQARTFTIFIFVSMLAYSAQDLILEPYAGAVFAFTPGASTKLTGVQHGGVLAGMIAVALASTWLPAAIRPSLRTFTMAGCLASAATLLMIAAAGLAPETWPLSKLVFLLGFFNGAFAVAAIGSMMALVADGRESREGVRMGLWGAAQGIAFGVGGLIGAAAVDIFRLILVSPVVSYASVFTLEAGLFILSAALAARIGGSMAGPSRPDLATDLGRSMMAEAAE